MTGEENVRDLKSLSSAKNRRLALALPCGIIQQVWQWGRSCTLELNTAW